MYSRGIRLEPSYGRDECHVLFRGPAAARQGKARQGMTTEKHTSGGEYEDET